MDQDLPRFRPFTREELEIIEGKIFDKKLQAKKKAEKRAKNVAVSWPTFRITFYIRMLYHKWLWSLRTICSSSSVVQQWKRISCKHNARWPHLSQLKVSAFFALLKINFVKKRNNLYLELVTPSNRWWRPIDPLSYVRRFESSHCTGREKLEGKGLRTYLFIRSHFHNCSFSL